MNLGQSLESPPVARNKASTLRREANARQFKERDGVTASPHMVICPVCLKEAPPSRSGSPRRFCSGRCRTVAWALRTIAQALHDGRADGLRRSLRELGRAA